MTKPRGKANSKPRMTEEEMEELLSDIGSPSAPSTLGQARRTTAQWADPDLFARGLNEDEFTARPGGGQHLLNFGCGRRNNQGGYDPTP